MFYIKSKKISGTITGAKKHIFDAGITGGERGKALKYFLITFHDENNNKVEFLEKNILIRLYMKVGDSVNVRVMPNNPKSAKVDTLSSPAQALSILLLFLYGTLYLYFKNS